MLSFRFLFIAGLLGCVGTVNTAFSTHLRFGYIHLRSTSNNSVEVKIFIYFSSGNVSPFNTDQNRVDFGDGTTMTISDDMVQVQPVVGLESTHLAVAMIQHTYDAPGKYLVSYTEPNRSEGIINFDNSVTTPFYLESLISIDPSLPALESPSPLSLTPFYGFRNIDYTASLASATQENIELQYKVVTPLQGPNKKVSEYVLPENFRVDPINGSVTWDNQINGAFVAGEYLFTIRIDQYTRVGDRLIKVGYMLRDLQVILTSDEKEPGDFYDNIGISNLQVFGNETFSFKVFSWYHEGEATTVNVRSTLPEANISSTTYDSAAQGKALLVTKITLYGSGDIVRNAPYPLSIENTTSTGEEKLIRYLNYNVFTQEYDPIMSVAPQVPSCGFFPNPARDVLKEGGSKRNEGEFVEIIHASGKVDVSPRESEISLSGLSPGIYMIRIRSNGRTSCADRVVKK